MGAAPVAFIGTKGEASYVEAVAATARQPRAFSMAGELNLRELLALFSITDLLVSTDSGPMHLACLVDTPVCRLFFADTPTLFAPVGSRTVSVAPSLYSMPLFTVYNGKDVVVGRSTETIKNIAACTVSVARVLEETRRLIAPTPRAGHERTRACERAVVFESTLAWPRRPLWTPDTTARLVGGVASSG